MDGDYFTQVSEKLKAETSHCDGMPFYLLNSPQWEHDIAVYFVTKAMIIKQSYITGFSLRLSLQIFWSLLHNILPVLCAFVIHGLQIWLLGTAKLYHVYDYMLYAGV